MRFLPRDEKVKHVFNPNAMDEKIKPVFLMTVDTNAQYLKKYFTLTIFAISWDYQFR